MNYGTANSADDRLSRLAGVSLTGDPGPLGQFAWMGAGRLVTLTMPQPGIALSYKQATGEPVGDSGDPYSGYDRFGRTVDMRWIRTSDQSSLSRIQYGYDKMSRRLWRQDLAAPATTRQDRFYGYDGLGQVVDAALGNLNINRTAISGIPSQREAFDYDPIGNWKDYLRQSDGLTTLNQERTHNKDNQLIELNGNASGLSYDASGNMTACRPDKDGDWSKGYTMVWDAWNRLVLVRNAQNNTPVASYAYDGLTRRVTTTIGSTVRRFFYNDVWKCIEERVGSASNPDRLYYWSTRTGHRDELLRRDRATSGGGPINETLWCLMDYFDPIAIANAAGVIQERYSYSAFGLATVLTPGFTARAASTFAWNFLFHGQFRDVETGWDNYGFRYYLPWLGRWTSRDPFGVDFGVNLFCMSHNSPSNSLDWFGLCDDCDGKKLGQLAVAYPSSQFECFDGKTDAEFFDQDVAPLITALALAVAMDGAMDVKGNIAEPPKRPPNAKNASEWYDFLAGFGSIRGVADDVAQGAKTAALLGLKLINDREARKLLRRVNDNDKPEICIDYECETCECCGSNGEKSWKVTKSGRATGKDLMSAQANARKACGEQ